MDEELEKTWAPSLDFALAKLLKVLPLIELAELSNVSILCESIVISSLSPYPLSSNPLKTDENLASSSKLKSSCSLPLSWYKINAMRGDRNYGGQKIFKIEEQSQCISPLPNEDLGYPRPQFLLLFLMPPFPTLSSEDLSQVLLYKAPRQRCFSLQTKLHLLETGPSF